MSSATSADQASHHHAVQFYGTETSLFSTVAGFLAEGLVFRQPAIVVATPSHRAGIVEHLSGRMIDCAKALREGDLIILDAEETLDLFMVGEGPNFDLFEKNIGRVIEQSMNGRKRLVIRAYGEMVDLLWKQGRAEAAIQLEMFWNKLATKYSFALLCGYAMGSFYKQTQHLDEICALHSHVVPTDKNVVPFERTIRPA
jgi:KaiC/GvpD/RAD55 family RecA-like ATPase